MSKAKELREMSDEQLGFSLDETRKELFNLRVQSATEKLDAPSNLRKLRREIARIQTIQTQRELAKSATEAPNSGSAGSGGAQAKKG